MKLLVQPKDGIEQLVKAINRAKKTVEILIFRFDRKELRQALVDAVQRGVSVTALIAFTNRGGEKKLRQLEADFLASGITVARTAGDLVRYHGKMMLVDRKELFVLGFNLTQLDIERSRSFGLVMRNPKLLREAARLFESDCKRQNYRPESDRFVVSPENARDVLARFIEGAKKELLIYDPQVSDRAMIRLLAKQQEAGVKLRIIGKVKGAKLPARPLKSMRLHVRLIIRDRDETFLGSQSLRLEELDARREIGVIFRHSTSMKTLVDTFLEDWASSQTEKAKQKKQVVIAEAPKKLAKAVKKEIPIDRVAEKIAKKIERSNGKGKTSVEHIEKTVKQAVKSSIKSVVKEALEDVVADTA